MTHSAFSTNTCAVITSTQEAGEAEGNHGDEAKNPYGSVGPYERRSDELH